MRQLVMVAVVLALSVAAPSGALGADSRVSRAGRAIVDEEQDGVVRGVVVRGESDEPVAGLVMILRRPRSAATRQFPEPWVADIGGNSPLARVETDALGRFSFKGLEPSRYSVTPRRRGLGSSTAHFLVTADTPAVDITLRVDLGGIVRGVVVDVDGHPLGRASVLVSGLDLGDGLNRLGRSHPDRVQTGPDGAFVLVGAPRGTVYIQSAQWEWGWSEPLAIPMRDTRSVEGVRIVLVEEPGKLAFDGSGGVGVSLDFTPAGPVIDRVYEDSPAEWAGLKSLDLISKVGGRATRFMTPEEFRARCRGEAGTTVELTIVRPDGTALEISVRRAANPWRERRR